MTELEEKIYRMIDNKFMHMTEEQLNDYDLKVEIAIKKVGSRRFSASKRNGYLARCRKSKRPVL